MGIYDLFSCYIHLIIAPSIDHLKRILTWEQLYMLKLKFYCIYLINSSISLLITTAEVL